MCGSAKVTIWLVGWGVVLALGAAGTATEEVFVDGNAPGAGTGANWTNAYNHLQDALAAASTGATIRVAQGVHCPDQTSANPSGNGDVRAKFQLINGVEIYGGYAGFGAADSNDRDLAAYETVLSGDVGIVGMDHDNSYHVVVATGTNSTAVLDGFTITKGNANIFKYDCGGGLYNTNGSATVRYCRFAGNDGDYGAGLYNGNGSLTIVGCTFAENDAYYDGGGVYNDSGSPTLLECTFSGNTANRGGGLYNESGAATVRWCLFLANAAYYGGDGGGMVNQSGSPSVTHCVFRANSSVQDGGGIYSFGGSPWVTHCVFVKNEAYGYGGGIVNWSDMVIRNSILWGNQADGGSVKDAQIFGASIDVRFSCIQDGNPHDANIPFGGSAMGNIDDDPLLVDPNGDDYHLRSQLGRWDPNNGWVYDSFSSPCIDAGEPSHPWTNELWPHGLRVNMGLYGNTPQASMSSSPNGNLADLNNDGWVNQADFGRLAGQWQTQQDLLPEDMDRNGIVNATDAGILSLNWLWYELL